MSRGYVMDVAAAYSTGFTVRSALNVLTISLVWGFGTVGYGPHRSRRILENARMRGHALVKMARLSSTDAEDAYRDGLWVGPHAAVPGLGTSFGTKFLYFASFAGAPSLRPLIYDANVALALGDRVAYRRGLLKRRAQVKHRAGDDHPSVPSQLRTYEYRYYLEYAHRLARSSGKSPDEIEMRLFESGRQIRAQA